MCGHCGCSTAVHHDHGHHGHAHDHGHHHDHHHHDGPDHHVIEIERSILSKNDLLAARNREHFAAHGIAVLNIVSSPGSGKTAILERSFQDLGQRMNMAVVVGDLATDNDARRLRSKNATAIQISTGTTCHLDAHMVGHAVEELDLDKLELLFIENVGNLVCPAAFDLGEDLRVVVTSVTEGEDKPLKYPVIFEGADIVLVSKIDLAQAVEFKRSVALKNIAAVAPRARIIEVSSKTGQGMDLWYEVLDVVVEEKHHAVRMHI